MPKQEKVKINVKERVDDQLIDLSLSDISEIPIRDIANFKRATILDLSSNKIVYLGKNFNTLTHLTRLDLSKNQIKFLPDDFGNLKNLAHLDLYNNRIEHLPLSFGNLTKLRYLDLKANPLTSALLKIVGPCLTTKDCNESAKNTVKFLARMQKEIEKTKEKLRLEREAEIRALEEAKKAADAVAAEMQKNKKNTKKNKNKGKRQKTNSTSSSQADIPKNGKLRNNEDFHSGRQSNSVFKTIVIFCFLLILNVIILYVVMVKNPEIAEKIVRVIPEQYRDRILFTIEDTKVNFLQVSGWLQRFISSQPTPAISNVL